MAVSSSSQLDYKGIFFHNPSRKIIVTNAKFPLEEVQRFYDALYAYNEILYRPENLFEYQLKPGSSLFI